MTNTAGKAGRGGGVTLQELGVGEEDSRQGEAAGAEHLLRAWEEEQEPQASVVEGGSQKPACEVVVGDH